MAQESKPNKTKWYKHGWGLVVAVLFFPYFIVWYAWAESKWSQAVKIAVSAVVAVVMLPIIIGMATADTTKQNANTNNDQPAASQKQEAGVSEPANAAPAKTVETPKAVEAPKPTATVSQKNAVRKAKSYISTSAFSHDGLVAQLEYEQFSNADAIYGADNSGADWNEQAAKKAKSYMDTSSFSRGSLISQLEYEKFTPEQAAHGADSVGL